MNYTVTTTSPETRTEQLQLEAARHIYEQLLLYISRQTE